MRRLRSVSAILARIASRTPAASFAEPLPAGGRLHLIGQLQSNKARPAVALFDVIESVDRPSLIDALEKEAERRGQRLPVLLQVNVAYEPQKAGCDPDAAPSLMERLVRSPWLMPQGLMTMAPLVDDPEEVRPVFAGLRTLRRSATAPAPRRRPAHALHGHEQRLSCCHRGGRDVRPHWARHLWRVTVGSSVAAMLDGSMALC